MIAAEIPIFESAATDPSGFGARSGRASGMAARRRRRALLAARAEVASPSSDHRR